MGNATMESKLQSFLEVADEQGRKRLAAQIKSDGRKVIGVLSNIIPEEIIIAAGAVPWYITGTLKSDTASADKYRSPDTCGYCTRVIESLMNGKLDFLDGVIGTMQCDESRRLFDYFTYLDRIPFAFEIDISRHESELGYQMFSGQLKKLIGSLENHFGICITYEDLNSAINVVNKSRALMKNVWELCKNQHLSGREAFSLSLASHLYPKRWFNQELESLMPFLRDRMSAYKSVSPRIGVTGEMIDNPEYIGLIEDSGAFVVMVDVALSRSSWVEVESNNSNTEQAIWSLARGYLNGHLYVTGYNWPRQFERLISWAEEFRVDAIVDFTQMFCYPRGFFKTALLNRLREAKVPCISIMYDYKIANKGQIITRVQALLEGVSA